MDSNIEIKLKTYYLNIKRKVIAGIVVEALLTLVYGVGMCLVYMSDTRGKRQMLDDLLLVVFGIIIAHLLMSVIAAVAAGRRKIRTILLTDEGLTINTWQYRVDLDPDDLRGTGFNFSTGLIQVLLPCAGQDLMVLSSDSSGKQIRRLFWTGPVNYKDAQKLRSELTTYLREGIRTINDSRYELVKDAIMTRPVTARINTNKFTRDKVIFSILIGAIAAGLIAGGAIYIDTIPMVVFMWGSAIFLVCYWLKILAMNRANIGNILRELKLTDEALYANGDRYDLKTLKTDMYGIGNPDPNTERTIRIQPPSGKSDTGLYLTLSDGSNNRRYWLGPQLDSEASAMVILSNYAVRISEAYHEQS